MASRLTDRHSRHLTQFDTHHIFISKGTTKSSHGCHFTPEALERQRTMHYRIPRVFVRIPGMPYLFRPWVDCGVPNLSSRPGRSVMRRASDSRGSGTLATRTR